MDNSKYNPYVLTSFENQIENNYILGIIPSNYNEDYYYEIHIETELLYINNIKDSIGDYIFIDLISNNRLEIYEGEFYEESCSDGEFGYISCEFKKIEKENKTIWKPKYLSLKSDFKKLFDTKIIPYELNKRKVVDNYRRIYFEEINKYNKEEIEKLSIGKLFHTLYQLFEDNPSWDSFNKLIDSNFQYFPTIKKDWAIEYESIEKLYNNLKTIDVENYSTIKSHMIELYKKTFNYMLPNKKYNYKDFDEKAVEDFFKIILDKLKLTEK